MNKPMISVVQNSERGEVGQTTYVIREDLIPYLLATMVPETCLLELSTYAEYTVDSPYAVQVLKNRIRGESYRETISDLVYCGLEDTKKEPYWSDNLDPKDDQTWVLCFVSDHSPEETSLGAKWINRVSKGGYIGHGREWKYATPVDLNLRFKEGG